MITLELRPIRRLMEDSGWEQLQCDAWPTGNDEIVARVKHGEEWVQAGRGRFCSDPRLDLTVIFRPDEAESRKSSGAFSAGIDDDRVWLSGSVTVPQFLYRELIATFDKLDERTAAVMIRLPSGAADMSPDDATWLSFEGSIRQSQKRIESLMMIFTYEVAVPGLNKFSGN